MDECSLCGFEADFRRLLCFLASLDQARKFLPIGPRHEPANGPANDSFDRDLNHFRKASIAVEDCSISRQGESAFVHCLDQNLIGLVRALERINPFPFGPRKNQGVHFPALNTSQHLFGLIQAQAKFFSFSQQFLFGFGLFSH